MKLKKSKGNIHFIFLFHFALIVSMETKNVSPPGLEEYNKF